jgi:pyruvate,water dikinase
VLGAGRRVEEMEGRLGSFAIGTPSDPGRAHAEIGRKLPVLFEMYDVHIQSSAVSGLMGGVLTQVLSGGSAPTPEDDAEVAGLLARAGGLASGEIVLDLEGLVLELASNPESVDRLVGADPRDALDWLRTGPSRTCFERFLERHGHRTLVELDMRRPSWADDPIPLVTMLGASVSAKLGRRAPLERRRVQPLRPGPAMRWLVRMTKDAVRGRERSKSLLVEYTDRFKKAYGHLAGLMVDRGLLPEVDALYFLTHEELGRLGSDPSLALLSATRRREHARNGRLEFAEISTGCPVPLEWRGGGADELCGKPVSRGVARGRARVVRSPEEAVGLEEGEILIAPHTDVGWTPYFSVIAGVGTEVGSAFCHGAVIAREYGLPAVVNLENATRLVRTGDMVLLDGDRGILRRLAE